MTTRGVIMSGNFRHFTSAGFRHLAGLPLGVGAETLHPALLQAAAQAEQIAQIRAWAMADHRLYEYEKQAGHNIAVNQIRAILDAAENKEKK
jgi:hypothetical protein